jgi:N-methylhydantoinase A
MTGPRDAGTGIGVDVGGTFTDLVAISPDGEISVRKVLTTPADQSEAVAAALDGFKAASVERIVHGTTVATNALLERKGARVVLCATRGFADVIALRRQDRASLYDLSVHHPAPLVPRELIVGVDERITPEGVTRPLAADEVQRVAAAVRALAPDVVAICLLHSYADPSHERALAEEIRRALPHADIVLSSDVFPEIREFERTTTTVAEAYLRPRVAEYLRKLSERLERAGFGEPAVMTSSGGMTPAREASRKAAQLALSGPAGGVVGAATVLDRLGIDSALTIDIGGTSADVGLILARQPRVEPGGAIAGIPIALPRVLVETVSAGGGSIAWIDDGGALRVGPRSAGSVPGPVAFGRGGTQPTVTDAHIALGNIRDARLSGGVKLDAGAARKAVGELAARLDAPMERVASAIIAAADASMARALRRVSVERGVDPRDCTLVAFGGGGPLHGCGLAEQIGVTRVLVPPHAGVLSAVGLALARERREAMASVMRRTDAGSDTSLKTLISQLAARLGGDSQWTHASTARARYVGQGHELDVPMPAGGDMLACGAAFETTHEALFGYRLQRPVEVVSLRHTVSGAERSVRLTSDARPETLEGPVSLALPDATLYVAPGWTARTLSIGGWMLERSS